jgi:hypothetical protein
VSDGFHCIESMIKQSDKKMITNLLQNLGENSNEELNDDRLRLDQRWLSTSLVNLNQKREQLEYAFISTSNF